MTNEEQFGIRNLSVIIKPTNNCNFNCKPCYASSGPMNRDVMSGETLENSITKISYFNGKGDDNCSSFIWHGGEPLLAGLGFFIDVVKIQKRLRDDGYAFRNAIQTNGSLIRKETVDFFKENEFSPSLSLDGPKEINDKTRIYAKARNGSYSTFDDVIRSIDLLKENGIDAGVVTVVNRHNIDCLQEVYDFFKSKGINAKFNPLFKTGRAKLNYSELCVSEEEYAEATFAFFKAWEKDTQPIHLECFENMLKSYLSNGCYSPECQFMDSCQRKFISIDRNGDVYPCAEFCGVTEFRYGNINSDSLEEILSSPLRDKLYGRSEKISDCQGCEHKGLCYGGCMQRAYAANGDIMGKDPLCQTFKMFFGYFSKTFLAVEDTKSTGGGEKNVK